MEGLRGFIQTTVKAARDAVREYFHPLALAISWVSSWFMKMVRGFRAVAHWFGELDYIAIIGAIVPVIIIGVFVFLLDSVGSSSPTGIALLGLTMIVTTIISMGTLAIFYRHNFRINASRDGIFIDKKQDNKPSKNNRGTSDNRRNKPRKK